MLSSPSADLAPAVERPTTIRATGGRSDAVALGGMAALAAGVFALQSGSFFRGDDWDGLAAFHDGPTLVPFDGALSLTSGLLFGVVAELASWNVWAYRAVAVCSFVVALTAIHLFMRRIVDRALAAAGTLALAAFTAATPLVTEPFAARIPLSVAVLVVLVRNLDATAGTTEPPAESERLVAVPRRDLASVLLVAVLLATSWVGVAGLAAVATTLAAQHASRQRWALFAVPCALWIGWFSVRGEVATPAWSWTSRARYAATLIGRTFQDLACSSSTLGVVAATGFGLVLWTDQRRALRPSWPPVRWLAAAVAYSLITTYRNGSIWFQTFGSHLPDGDTWVLAAFVVLAGAESLRGRLVRVGGSRRAIVLGGAGIAVTLSTVTLVHGVQAHRDADPPSPGLVVEQLAAVESVGRIPDDSWTVPIDRVDVPARNYLAIVDDLGSPLDFLGLDADETDEGLQRQDDIVMAGLGIEAIPGTCQWLAGESESLTVEGPARVIAAAVYGQEPTPLYITRRARFVFGEAPLTTIAPLDSVIVTIPDDDSGFPWSFVVGAGGVIGTCVE